VGDLADDIAQIQEEPFVSLSARLQHLNDIQEREDEPPDLEALDAILREAAVATVIRETRLIKEDMRDKGIGIFSTAPKEYMTWKNPNRMQDPILDPETCGIPGLRRWLFSLPANTNFQRYRDHVFKDIPKLRKRATRVQEKHVEDEGYAEMRRQLEQETPELRISLKQTADSQMKRLVSPPWAPHEESKVIELIESLITNKWKHPLIFYSGFAKMLRENGIPIDGKYCGRNLNEELLETMIQYIHNWNTKMTTRAEQLAQRLHKLIQDLLEGIRLRIETSNAVQALKNRASEALAEALQGVEEARASLLESLLSTRAKTTCALLLKSTSFVELLRKSAPWHLHKVWYGSRKSEGKHTTSSLKTFHNTLTFHSHSTKHLPAPYLDTTTKPSGMPRYFSLAARRMHKRRPTTTPDHALWTELFRVVRSDVKDLKADLRSDLKQVNLDIRANLDGLKQDMDKMKTEVAETRGKMAYINPVLILGNLGVLQASSLYMYNKST
jgi:hypothetical protein